MRILPVLDAARQEFSIVLGTRRVSIGLEYNTMADRWFMSLAIDDAPILTSRKVVLNVDLLAPYDFGIGAVFAYAANSGTEPGRAQLPDGRVSLFHMTEAEVAAARAA
ncbi:phage baseplate plug protein [Aurantimonas coralicida]|uniref:phage baseplate plug family protein n=1 Tax=Aurantimonas coralicida TaxID=182270 RepID=UPI001E3B4306|nr:hypothetical protein [Aurantimonas coralicida]MCD1645242.1 hypothetical protein [Aurantimonas coralicida]